MEIFQLKDNRYQQTELTQFQLTSDCVADADIKDIFSLPGLSA